MLWLAGLMGLMAVGAVAYVDIDVSEDTGDLPPDIPEDGTTNLGDILIGTDGVDAISGGAGDDQIGGYGGDDVLFGRGGSDDVHGADGNDTLTGDIGDDSINGDDGDDNLSGGDDDDSVMGHNDDDMLHGGAGDDTLIGAEGNDTLMGDTGDDALHGGLDDDVLHGGSGTDTLFGGWGNDTLSGLGDSGGAQGASLAPKGLNDGDEADFLNGGGGDDLIISGQDDIVTAGDGADQIVLGDWITQGHAAHIMDYTATDDSLLFVWDDSIADSTEPDVSVLPDPDASGDYQVLMGDILVARVTGDAALDASDISLIPLSLAYSTGLITV